MATYLNQNQFTQTPAKGEVSMVVSPSIIPVKYNPDATGGAITPGMVVKLVDVAGSEIVVDLAATTELSYGVVVYNPKKNSYAAGYTLEIATRGTYVYMESKAAIARGAFVECDVANVQVLTAAGTNKIIGQAIDKATAANQLIRVVIDPRLYASV